MLYRGLSCLFFLVTGMGAAGAVAGAARATAAARLFLPEDEEQAVANDPSQDQIISNIHSSPPTR